MRKSIDIDMGRQERMLGEALRGRPSEGCPSADDLVGFVDGALSDRTKSEVILHVGHCLACRDAVFEMRAADRAGQRRFGLWQKYAPGLGLAFGLAAVAGAVVIGMKVTAPAKSPSAVPSIVAVNNPKHDPIPNVSVNRTLASPGAQKVSPRVGEIKPRSGPTEPTSDHANHNSLGNTQVATAHETNKQGASASTKGIGTAEDTKGLIASNGDSSPASRVVKFLLVGQNHVYSMDSPDAKQTERRAIEQDYADNVAAYQSEYKRVLEAGEDPVAAADDLNVALQGAATDRDNRLADLYPTADSFRRQQPELKVEGDAPYQVVQVQYSTHLSSPTPSRYVVYAPWPGYVAEDNPYGWQYGVEYSPDEFRNAYSDWHRSFVASGRVFSGLRSHYGRVQPDLVVRSTGPRYGLRSVSPSKYARSAAGGGYRTALPHSPSRYETLGSGLRTYGGRYPPGITGPGPSKYSRTLGNHVDPGTNTTRSTGGSGYRHDFGTPPPTTRPGESRYNRGTSRGKSG